MKELNVCESLCDSMNNLITWKYCAPIFITDQFGILFNDKIDISPNNHKNDSVRNGTVTFISYNKEFFALTCKHVVDSLEKRQGQWREEQHSKYGFIPPEDEILFFTPLNNCQYHFNYRFSPVTINDDELPIDISITRIKPEVMSRLGRQPIELKKSDHNELIHSDGIASGYPEDQRVKREKGKLNVFCPKFVTLLANLQLSSNEKLILEGDLDKTNGLNNLSGMSGGPIIGFTDKDYCFLGISYEAYNINPQEAGVREKPGIFIKGERITFTKFEKWISAIPKNTIIRDRSQRLIIPASYNCGGLQT